MEFKIISQKDQDLGRGVALMGAGAMMMLLKFVLPIMAPIALAGYAFYRLFAKNYLESAVTLAVALALWYLQGLVGWVLLMISSAMVGFGVFFLIRGMREKNRIE